MAKEPFVTPVTNVTTEQERPAFVSPDVETVTLTPEKDRPAFVSPDAPTTKRRPFAPPSDVAYLEFAEQAGIDDKKAKAYEDATINSLAFDIPPSESMRSKSGIDLALSHNPQAMQKREDAKSLYNGMSTIGSYAYYQPKAPRAQAARRLKRDEVIDIAKKYRDAGLIQESEFQEHIKRPYPGDTFINTFGVYTDEDVPPPSAFFVKTFGERAEEVLPSVAGGVNGAIASAFRGAQWLEGETGVNIGAKGIADWLDENAQFATKGTRPDFMTDFWGAWGSFLPLVAGGEVVGATGLILGLSARLALALNVSAVVTAESLMNAGQSHENILREGGTPEEAKSAARVSFVLNMPLNALTSGLGLYRARFKAIDDVVGVRTIKQRAVEAGKETIRAGVGEFGQESTQSIIGDVAEKKPINIPKAAYEGIIAFFVGGPTGGAFSLMSTAAQKIDAIGPMPDATAQIYDNKVQEGVTAGLTGEQANIEATQEIAKTPEGREYIDKVMQAQEAVIEAEAAMGRDVEAPAEAEAAPDPIDDISARLERGEITEAQAETEVGDALLSRLIEPIRGEEGAVRVPQALQEQVTELEERAEADFKGRPLTPREAQQREIEEALDPFEGREPTEAERTLEARRRAEIEARTPQRPVVSLVEHLRTDPIARQREIDTGVSLLTEQGHINLQAEVALDVIRDRLSNFAADPRQGIQDVMNIGRAVFAEGKVRVQDFTAQMQEIAGEAWETIKPYVQRAWEILNNEVGAVGRDQTNTPAFKAWFKDSKVVDDNGEPLVVFHGTNQPITSFAQERLGASTSSVSAKGAFFLTDDAQEAGEYAQLSAEKVVADAETHDIEVERITREMEEAEARQDFDAVDRLTIEFENLELGAIRAEPQGQNILPTYLSIQNPLVVNVSEQASTGRIAELIAQAKEAGNDGLILEEIQDRPSGIGEPTTHYAVFAPTQIKSATGNVGTFDPTVADIRGSIDLNAEISLAPIIERLQNFAANPEQGAKDMMTLANSVWAEGKTQVKDFMARMKEVLGDLFETLKPHAQKAWNILANERGAIEIGPEGQAEFDIDNRIQAIRTQARSQELPSFMEDNPTWSEEEVDSALDRAQEGQPITEREAEIVHAALAEAGANFYQEAIGDEFITLEPDEINEIIEQGIQDFVSKLEVVKPVVLTATQKAKKERTKEFARRGKEIQTLQDTLKEQTFLLHQSVQDQASIRQEAKVDTKAAKETVKRLESKISTRDKQVATLREKAKTVGRALTKPSVKAQVRQATGQVPVADLIREDVALREGLRKSARAALQAARVADKAGVARERARARDMIDRAQDKARQASVVKKTVKRLKKLKKSKKQNIAVDYQKRINSVIDTIDLKGKPTEKTLNSLISLKDWLDTHNDKMPIPQERLDQLTRLGKLSLQEMTPEDVKEIDETIKTLVQIGKLKRRLQVKYDKQRLAEVTKEFTDTVVNIDGDYNAADPTPGQIFKRGVKSAYLVTMHVPRVADMQDGFNDYNGVHAKLSKDFFARETNSNMTSQAIVKNALDDIIEKAGIKELTEEQQDRIMINIRLQEGAHGAVKTLMERKGYTSVPAITAQEQQFIDIIQESTNLFTDQLAATVEEIDNQIFPRAENYILPLKYEKGEITGAPPLDSFLQGGHRTAKTPQGFKIERVKGVKKTPRTDILAIFEETINAQQWYLNMQPALEEARQVVLSEEYAEAAGELNYDYWKEELDIIANRGWSATAGGNKAINAALRQGRINLNKAVLGYKASSILMQPFAIFDAMAYTTMRWGPQTSLEMTKEFTKSWIKPNYAQSIIDKSPTLQLRNAGELAVEEVLDKTKGKGFIDKFIRGSFSALRHADVKTAAGVREGILHILQKRGVENAEAEADFLMNMVSGSSEVTIRPQVLSKGEGARSLFTFQSFFLNRWGLVAHDLIAGGVIKGGWKRKMTALLGLAILMAGGLGEDEAREIIFEATTGKELPEDEALERILLYIPSMIPLLGPMIEASFTRRSSEIPLVRTVKQAGQGAARVVTGKDLESRAKGVLKFTESAVTLRFGVPGTAQFFDFAERILFEEKKGQGRRR